MIMIMKMSVPFLCQSDNLIQGEKVINVYRYY